MVGLTLTRALVTSHQPLDEDRGMYDDKEVLLSGYYASKHFSTSYTKPGPGLTFTEACDMNIYVSDACQQIHRTWKKEHIYTYIHTHEPISIQTCTYTCLHLYLYLSVYVYP